MSSDNRYIGITIGPVLKTIQNAKKTGQLWGASYIFSYIAKHIIKRLKDNRLVENFIMPYADDSNKPLGAGLYPDRIIFQAREFSYSKFDSLIKEIFIDIADQIAKALNLKNKDDLIKYLEDYFQIYYVETNVKENENPILKISPYLDQLDLNEKIIPNGKYDFLMEFFKNENIKNSFLSDDAFGDTMNLKSLPEIASIEVDDLKWLMKDSLTKQDILENDEDYYDKFYQKLQGNNRFRKYHKYFAVVQADGDNIGKLISRMNNSELYRFSKKLFDYSKEAVQYISANDGLPIYAGGDDLLFFAPVYNKNKTIFDLLAGISERFNNHFAKERNRQEVNQPAISFGLSIAYYKFPLYEALEIARNLLFDQAKNYSLNGKDKYAIAFSLIKHSGQKVETIQRQDSAVYNTFKQMLIEQGVRGETNSRFLSSVIYRIMSDKIMLKEMLSNGQSLEIYFNNTFKEHEQYQNILKSVQNLIDNAYQDCINGKKKPAINNKIFDECFNQIHSLLKFIKFLNEEGN